MKQPIYLDYAATTPVAPEVVDAMNSCLTSEDIFGNPSSTANEFGLAAEKAVEEAHKNSSEFSCQLKEIRHY